MKRIIEMIYNGQIAPAVSIVPQDTDYWDTASKIGEEWRYFRKKFPEDKKRLDELEGLILSLSDMHLSTNFDYAFKLGALLMCEILLDGNVIKNSSS